MWGFFSYTLVHKLHLPTEYIKDDVLSTISNESQGLMFVSPVVV